MKEEVLKMLCVCDVIDSERCVWVQFTPIQKYRSSAPWIQRKSRLTNRTVVVERPPNGCGNWCESILCVWCGCVRYLLLLLRFPVRRLFKFIYVKIKLNASPKSFHDGRGTEDASQPLNYELALLECVKVSCFSVYLPSIQSRFLNTASTSSSFFKAQTRLRVESILRQQVNHRRCQWKINIHMMRTRIQRTHWMERIDYINI